MFRIKKKIAHLRNEHFIKFFIQRCKDSPVQAERSVPDTLHCVFTYLTHPGRLCL